MVGDLAANDKIEISSSLPMREDLILIPSWAQANECCFSSSSNRGIAVAIFESISCLNALDRNLTDESRQTLSA